MGSLDAPDSGRVSYKGQDLYGVSARERSGIRASQIGFVFQAYHLLPELDVLENVLLPAMTGQGPAKSLRDMQKRAKELLATVGLHERAEHRPVELSGGEQQRLALARAMMNDPEVILADEPTGNLDDDTATQVLDHVFALVEKRGRTLVLVTHNESLASRCDRVVHLADGVLS
jgi:predicted ABC-type transport system involved in lysophospholipase L1 biosynthesis ATPase subunit